MPIVTITAKARVSTQERNIKLVKEFIYGLLSSDVKIVELVGENIQEQFPPDIITLPSITYNIINEEYYAFNETSLTSSSSTIVFGIDIDSETTNADEIDLIEKRVFQLFHGKSFSTDALKIHFITKTYNLQYYDPENRLWKYVTRYRMKLNYK